MKSITEYLNAAGGNHEAALKDMHADFAEVNQAAEKEAGNSIRARKIVEATAPLFEALGIELPTAGARPSEAALSALSEAVKGTLDDLADLEESRDTWMGLASEAGLDVDAVVAAETPEAASEIINGWLGGIDAILDSNEELAPKLAAYQFAHENNLNPSAVLLQKGLEGLQQFTTKETVDGKEVEKQVWGIPGAKEGEFTPALEHLKPVLGMLTAEQKASNWTVKQDSVTTPPPATDKQLDEMNVATGDYSL